MRRFILKRLLWLVPVILGVTWLIFTIMYLIPGSPATSMLGSGATQEEIAQAEEMLGLNGSYLERLGRYIKTHLFTLILELPINMGPELLPIFSSVFHEL